MKIAVIGLGIIGGSFCKAIKKHTERSTPITMSSASTAPARQRNRLCATARLMKSEAPRRSRKPI